MADLEADENLKKELAEIRENFKKELDKLRAEQSAVLDDFMSKLEEKRKSELRENLNDSEK